MLQCQDCLAFAESLKGALPYLDPKIFRTVKSRQTVLVIIYENFALRCTCDISFLFFAVQHEAKTEARSSWLHSDGINIGNNLTDRLCGGSDCVRQ